MSADANPLELETDPRFPSGQWLGFWVQRQLPPGKHPTELRLTFCRGSMTGDGRDWVGEFIIRGWYDLGDGCCHWTKRYLGRHDVFYQGYNEGKGIWGQWEIPAAQNAGVRYHGGYHIWPEGMDDPTNEHLTEEADLPVPAEEAITVGA